MMNSYPMIMVSLYKEDIRPHIHVKAKKTTSQGEATELPHLILFPSQHC